MFGVEGSTDVFKNAALFAVGCAVPVLYQAGLNGDQLADLCPPVAELEKSSENWHALCARSVFVKSISMTAAAGSRR